jgi:hypothetical protein
MGGEFMKKRMCSLALIVVLVFSLATSAQASTYQLQWTNTTNTTTSLSFSGTTATCQAIVIGNTGTSKISAKIVLYEKDSSGSYVQFIAWSTSTYSEVLNFCKYAYKCTSGSTYKLYVTAKVYNAAGVGETVTAKSIATCS